MMKDYKYKKPNNARINYTPIWEILISQIFGGKFDKNDSNYPNQARKAFYSLPKYKQDQILELQQIDFIDLIIRKSNNEGIKISDTSIIHRIINPLNDEMGDKIF